MANSSIPFFGYGVAITEEDRQRWHEQRSRHAQMAFDRGSFCCDHGMKEAGFFWLGRAERLSGDTSNVMFAYAMAALELGHWDIALSRFQKLHKKFDLREAAFGEVLCLHRKGDVHQACKTLHTALTRYHASPGMGAVARNLMEYRGGPGWGTLSNSGFLDVEATGRVSLSWDGHALGEATAGRIHISQYVKRLYGANWAQGHYLDVRVNGRPLLGSPFDIRALTACENVVQADEKGITGWIWYPAEPDFDPSVTLDNGRAFVASHIMDHAAYMARPLCRPRAFFIPISQLPGEGQCRVVTRETHGRVLWGSPVDPRIGRLLSGGGEGAETLFPIEKLPKDAEHDIEGAECAVIIPVYGAYHETRLCLLSVLQTVPSNTMVIVVNDASPDKRIACFLERLSVQNKITLLRNNENKGFVRSVNVALRYCNGCDVVLLNSDTVVFPGWLERLKNWLRQPHVGTVTPMSNAGGLTSYPSVEEGNHVPSLRQARELDRLCQRIETLVELPTGNGFCMAVSSACLQSVGLLREELFAQGYGEENDFCLRATEQGFRHLAATNVYVRHQESSSFQGGRSGLLQRNLHILNALYPGYSQTIHQFEKEDILHATRKRIDWLRFERYASVDQGSVLLIKHKAGGGVARAVRQRAACFAEQGIRAFFLTPDEAGCTLTLYNDPLGRKSSLCISIPSETVSLVRLLKILNVRHVEWHHLMGHAPWIRYLHRDLDVPYDIFIHDHIFFCPRISLFNGENRYCGEPDVVHCEQCVARWGHSLEAGLSVTDLLHRSTSELREARYVVAPSLDAARRLKRHLPVRDDIRIMPLDDDQKALGSPIKPSRGRRVRRVGVVGGISRWKGYELLLALGRHIQDHHVPLEIILIGSTTDDAALLATGIQVTGEYQEDDLPALIRAANLDLGFIPSVAPETWCYVLGELWRAGLEVCGFDIGASGERIRESGRGQVLPLGMPVERIADYFLRYRRSF